MRAIVVGAALAAACARVSSPKPCTSPDGQTWECVGANDVCTTPANGYCLNGDDVAACMGMSDFAACSSKHTLVGACYNGSCQSCETYPDFEGCPISGWQQMTINVTTTLNGLWVAPTPSFEAYAVGDSGTVIHYDGASWSPTTVPTSSALQAVWGSTPSDVYAVGNMGTIVHFDGTRWTTTMIGGQQLLAVWGSSSSDVYAVGGAGTVLHFDGASWQPVAPGNAAPLHGVWSHAGQLYVADNVGVAQWNGSTWSTAYATTATLDAMWGDANSSFAVGQPGGATMIPAAASFNAMWGALGMDPQAASGLAMLGVWGDGAGNVYAITNNSAVFRYSAGAWSSAEQVAASSTNDLRAISGRAAGEVFVAGVSGAVWRHAAQ